MNSRTTREMHSERRAPRPRPRTATTLALLMGAAVAMLGVPAMASAAITQVEPIDGTHFDHLERAPVVAFDPGVDAQPKWVLLATDPEMKTTVRFCRQFMWVATQSSGLKWGCNRWATGADSQGNDILEAVKPGATYYWQVVAKASPTDATEVKSAIRSFTLDPERADASIADVSNKIMGTVFDDGTQLNLGAAAFVNSKVKVATPTAKRLSTYGFRLKVKTSGSIDPTKSYIQIKSAAGTRYIRVSKVQGGVQGVYTLNATERKLKTKRFSYSVWVKSTANASLVRSRYAVLVIRSVKASSSKTTTGGTEIPVWVPD